MQKVQELERALLIRLVGRGSDARENKSQFIDCSSLL